jgi:hypothetical protein
MRNVRHLLALLPLLATGCRYPDDPIFAYGRALHADGSPLAGATLTVERAPPRPLEEELEGIKGPPAFSPYGTSTTQANGDFTQQFLAGDVEETDLGSGAYVQYRFRMALPLEEGQGSFLSFTFTGDVELPTLQPWDARFTVGGSSQEPTLSFASAPAAAELPPSGKERILIVRDEAGGESQVTLHPTAPEPIVQLLTGGELLWLQHGVSSPWVPGPYVLEDFASPEAQLRAVSLGVWTFSPLGSTSSYVDFRQEWRTPRLPLPGGASRPVSRGASCQPSPVGACPWTDGQLTPVDFTDNLNEAPQSLVITLAEPKQLVRAVIRGLKYGHVYVGAERLRLEGSADGESWAPLANVLLRNRSRRDANLQAVNEFFADNTSWDSPFDRPLELYSQLPVFLDVPLESAGPVRHVRLQVEIDSTERPIRGLFSLAEVSLFE